jgi:Uncharacterized protein conserved in bacteria (DUF2252)
MPRRISSTTTRTFAPRRSLDELYEEGKWFRDKCPRQSHAVWQVPANRVDPVSLLVQSSKGRIPQLIPVRYGRMMRTPFTFYRGAARSSSAAFKRRETKALVSIILHAKLFNPDLLN